MKPALRPLLPVPALLALLALLPSAPASGQRPVGWRLARRPATEALRAGAPVQLRLSATMRDGWYIYSLTQPPGGPFRSSIALPDAGPLRSDGDIEAPPPESHDDANFGIVTEIYRRAVTFGIPARLSGSPQDTALVLVRFQTCNDTTCLPPRTDTVRLAMAAPTRRAADAAGAAPPAPAAPAGGAPGGRSALAGRGALAPFLWLALVMGLLSLLTPCVFPMVPLTVGFFTRAGGEATARAGKWRATVYALGIVASFTALGITVTLAFGAGGVTRLASNPWLNLAVTALFLGFALNLLGAFELRLPAGLLTRTTRIGSAHGAGAALLLGSAFALTTFTCTAPFVGTLLVLATQGTWSWPVLGLLVFSGAFALPFFLLALLPDAVARLPRSGPWLLSLRRALGVLEIAAAAKFLSNADLVLGWGIFTRDAVIGIWMLAGLALALLLLGPGVWRSPAPRARVLARAALALLALAGTGWLGTGLRGSRLGEIEAFLPPPAGGALPDDGRELPWRVNDLPGTLARARAERRPVLLDFTGYTCTNCRWMEANMFPRPEVRARLQPFVRARLFTDGMGEPFGAQQALEERMFGTVALPLYAILSPAGEPVASFTGMTRNSHDFNDFLTRGLALARAR